MLFHLVPKHTFVNTKDALGISACVYVKVKVDAYQILVCQKIIIQIVKKDKWRLSQ